MFRNRAYKYVKISAQWGCIAKRFGGNVVNITTLHITCYSIFVTIRNKLYLVQFDLGKDFSLVDPKPGLNFDSNLNICDLDQIRLRRRG